MELAGSRLYRMHYSAKRLMGAIQLYCIVYHTGRLRAFSARRTRVARLLVLATDNIISAGAQSFLETNTTPYMRIAFNNLQLPIMV